jgi:hypothetical protein
VGIFVMKRAVQLSGSTARMQVIDVVIQEEQLKIRLAASFQLIIFFASLSGEVLINDSNTEGDKDRSDDGIISGMRPRGFQDGLADGRR